MNVLEIFIILGSIISDVLVFGGALWMICINWTAGRNTVGIGSAIFAITMLVALVYHMWEGTTMVKSINGWPQGTMKKPTDNRTMPDIPQHNKCIFCDGQENKYIGVTKAMRMKLKDNLLVATDKISSDVWQIKYCPICGRKLNDGKA